jgi:threonine/homoserine/homoserine lactone efflux protein
MSPSFWRSAAIGVVVVVLFWLALFVLIGLALVLHALYGGENKIKKLFLLVAIALLIVAAAGSGVPER